MSVAPLRPLAPAALSPEVEALRMLAEAQLQQTSASDRMRHDESQRLLHELQVRHVELEMQNEELRQTHESLRLAACVFQHSYDAIMVTNGQNLIVDVNPAFTRATGYQRHEVLGRSPSLITAGLNPAEQLAQMNAVLSEQGCWSGELWSRRKNGEICAGLVAVSVVRDASGRPQQYVSVTSDISGMKRHEAELDRIANYDLLTGLPNRRLFFDRLKQSMSRVERSGETLAVCYLDLDGFKRINDRFGHEAGDTLLVEITRRLSEVMRGEDTIARLGGDEFVLLADLGPQVRLETLLHRVLDCIKAPHSIEGKTVTVSASIGVALYPQDCADAEILLRHADQAMYKAKSAGKNRFELFDLQQSQQTLARHEQLERLRLALDQHEFQLLYQPKVDLVSGVVSGAEALLRWTHPERGLLLPAEFLSHLDGTALELAVGEWVIAAVLRQQTLWRREGLDLVVSINIAPKHLLQGNFTERLAALLADAPEVPPDRLELEILESAALEDIQHAAHTLQRCRALGVHFALDDFGTGYSSLNYFRTLPVDTLKIDQSFVRDMLTDPNDRAIVEAVVRLADTFGRHVIAEGVETLAHGLMLVSMGCRHCQGFGIAHPLEPQALAAWATAWQRDQPWRQWAPTGPPPLGRHA